MLNTAQAPAATPEATPEKKQNPVAQEGASRTIKVQSMEAGQSRQTNLL